MKNVEKIAVSILATEVGELDPKIGNRIKQMKDIYQKMKKIEEEISTKVGNLQKELKSLEKQSGIFEKELMPILKDLQDHAIKAEGIYVELKTGRRSPKVGYDYLAERVNSEMLRAAEEAIAKAAEFAQSPSIALASINKQIKTAGIFDGLKKLWDKFTGWIKGMKKKVDEIGNNVDKLDAITT